MKTIRLYASANIIKDHNINFLSDKFNVLSPCEISGCTYDPNKGEDCSHTDYSILVMHEFLTDREPQHEWFQRLIYPIVDYSNFTYIIMHNFDKDEYYTSTDKYKIHYVNRYKIKSYEDVIRELIKND